MARSPRYRTAAGAEAYSWVTAVRSSVARRCRDFLAAQPPEGYSVIQALWYQQLAAVDPCLGANNFASVL